VYIRKIQPSSIFVAKYQCTHVTVSANRQNCALYRQSCAFRAQTLRTLMIEHCVAHNSPMTSRTSSALLAHTYEGIKTPCYALARSPVLLPREVRYKPAKPCPFIRPSSYPLDSPDLDIIIVNFNMPSSNNLKIASTVAHVGAWAPTTLEPIDDSELLGTPSSSNSILGSYPNTKLVCTCDCTSILAEYKPNTNSAAQSVGPNKQN
jgi:hypothetical protein